MRVTVAPTLDWPPTETTSGTTPAAPAAALHESSESVDESTGHGAPSIVTEGFEPKFTPRIHRGVWRVGSFGGHVESTAGGS